MHILFENNVQVPIELNNSPAQDTLLGFYKHLQHVPIPYKEWDSPFYINTNTFDTVSKKLIESGARVGVTVNPEDRTQPYLNHLHEIYEKNYDGRPEWLVFHEHIHLCERYYQQMKHPGSFETLMLDYREKSGPLEKPFNRDWMAHTTTKLQKGDVYLLWAELSKPPYDYWRNHEPNDINRICELAKPWLIIKPKLAVSLGNVDRVADIDIDQEAFNNWWKNYEQPWCKHYGLESWTLENQLSVLVVGKVLEVDQIIKMLKDKIYPIKVEL